MPPSKLKSIPKVAPSTKRRRSSTKTSDEPLKGQNIFVILLMTLLFLSFLSLITLSLVRLCTSREAFEGRLDKLLLFARFPQLDPLKNLLRLYFVQQHPLSIIIESIWALSLMYYFGMVAWESEQYDEGVPWGSISFSAFAFAVITGASIYYRDSLGRPSAS